jgi:tetratricopeptide (TPR) repeat protein
MLREGDLDGAARTAREALGRDGKDARAHAVLGQVEAGRGQLQRALRHLTQARRAGDRRPETARVLGQVYRELGRWDDAARAFRAQADAAPDDADAWFNHARSLIDAGRHEESVTGWRSVLKLAPDDADACANLGATLWQLGRREEAVLELELGLERSPAHAGIANKLRDALQLLGAQRLTERDAIDARELLERALDLGADDAELHANLAAALTAAGEVALASEHHQLAIERDTTATRSWYALARWGEIDDPAPLEQLVARDDLPARDVANVHYALGEVHERAQRFEPAFQAFTRANEIRAAASGSYDPRALDALVEQLIEAFPVERFENLPKGPAGEHALVVGMPRSGTTLVERILDAHPAVSGLGERTELPQLVGALPGETVAGKLAVFGHGAAQSLATSYRAALGPPAHGVERLIDKLPMNLLHLGWAALAFPGLRVVHCRRDPRDTILSCWTRNFEGDHNLATFDLDHLAALHASCERLMQHWHRALPRHLLAVDYETLVQSPDRTARRLVAFLDLPWNEQCLTFHRSSSAVFTASAEQVRRPVYTTSVGRWRDYERWAFPAA